MRHLPTAEDKAILIIVMLKKGNGPSVKVQQFSCTAAKARREDEIPTKDP